MTIEQKAKAYDEALERFKSFKEKYYTKDTNLGDVIFDKTGEMQKDFESIFPQLAESEDEKIRKAIIKSIEEDSSVYEQEVSKEQMLAYLEKQKELPFVKDVMLGYPGVYFYDGERMHFRGNPAMEEKLKEQKPKNELPDYDININDLEEFPEELLKHYNELLIDAGEIGRKVGEIVSASLKKHYILGLQAGKKESNEQKEQKPWKVGANAYFTPEQKPAEWVLPEDFEDAVYKVANFISPFDSQEELRKVSHRFAEQLLSLAKKELDKPAEWDEYTKMNLDRALQIIKEAKGTLQGYQTDDGIYECDKAIEALEHFLYRGLEIEKSAEWSEEDEKMSMSILNLLCSQVAYLTNNGKTTGKLFPTYANERDWFKKRIKSLRPQYHGDVTMTEAYKMGFEAGKASSWKPSEDEKRLINTSIAFLKYFADQGYENAVECIDWLKTKLK